MRLSLRTKMIATSALLIAFVVLVFGFVTNQMMSADLEEEQVQLRERRRAAMIETGTLLAATAAEGGRVLVAMGEINDLQFMVEQLTSSSGEDQQNIDLRQVAMLDTQLRVPRVLAWSATHQSGDSADTEDPEALPEFTPEMYGMETFRGLDHTTHVEVDGDSGTSGSFVFLAPFGRGGLALIELSTGPLEREIQEIEVHTEERITRLTSNSAILGGLALLLGVFIAIIQSLRITNPILRLAGTAERIAAGDFDTRAVVKARDEVGKLSQSFNNMAERLQELLEETAEKATMQKELEVARIIQETLLPPSGVLERGPLRMYGFFRSASVCGGDFWNVADIDDNRTLIVIGDVTGHGVPSAMITASAKSSMDTVRSIRGKNLSLTFLLEEMNKTIFASAKRKFVMTFFALMYDRARQEVTFSNAGHNFPFLLRRENGKVGIRGLVARGNRLGDVEDSRFMEQKLRVQPGDLIVLYTDGLTEYQNTDGEEYSERRFRRVLRRSFDMKAEEIGRDILRDLSQFAAQAPQEDDVTLVIVKVGQTG